MGSLDQGTQDINMKSFACLAAFIATASAAPQLLGHGVVAHGAVGGYAQPDLAEVSPYSYNYGVADEYSGAAFSQSESNDGTGVVQGSYSVNLPDGRIQTVNYHANDYDGYVAEVTYSGEPAYPTTHAVAHPVVHAAPLVHAGHGLAGHGLAGHGLAGHGLAGHGLVGHGLVGGRAVLG